MKYLRFVVILCLVLLPAFSQAADIGYGYPIPGAYEATILGTPDNLKAPSPARIAVKQIVLNVIPDLKKPNIFFYDEGLYCTLAYQNTKAPLVFLIAGTGAGDQSQKAVAMMKGARGHDMDGVVPGGGDPPEKCIKVSLSVDRYTMTGEKRVSFFPPPCLGSNGIRG